MILALTHLQTGQVVASLRLWAYIHRTIGTMAHAPPEILEIAKDGAFARMSLAEIDELVAEIERQNHTPVEPALRAVAAWVETLPLNGEDGA